MLFHTSEDVDNAQRRKTIFGDDLAPDVSSGSNHPDAFQRLLEMELRAKSRRTTHPFPAVGHSQGMYGGHDRDMGFRMGQVVPYSMES
ncbi:hypothetical protein Vadar_009261 [Vaccinium darrowii]|uniref:Uncharacterized protein n=1 Tax=Vaccinium darrowii TaxID=229202 RepID=A0ACB7XPH5_9ERIC|nr:hypothetical protein Vadar_009261 [Vaccinium darrowii]